MIIIKDNHWPRNIVDHPDKYDKTTHISDYLHCHFIGIIIYVASILYQIHRSTYDCQKYMQGPGL